MERSGYHLTPQPSDGRDRELGIDEYLFLNVYDQHADVVFDQETREPRSVFGINKYGPVLMVFRVGLLEHVTTEIRSYAKEITDADFEEDIHDITDLQEFIEQTFKYTVDYAWSDEPSRRPSTRGPNAVIYFRDDAGGVDLSQHLDHVVVDVLPENLGELQDRATRDVDAALGSHGLDADVHVRECVERCGCGPGYGMLSARQVERFFYETNMEVYGINLPKTV